MTATSCASIIALGWKDHDGKRREPVCLQQQVTKNRHRLWEATYSGIGEAKRSARHGNCYGRRSAQAQLAPSWTVERGRALLSPLGASALQHWTLRDAPFPAISPRRAILRHATLFRWQASIQPASYRLRSLGRAQRD